MSKNHIWALVLIGLAAVVLIFNHGGSIKINLVVTTISAAKSLVMLGFIALGVVIGVLFK